MAAARYIFAAGLVAVGISPAHATEWTLVDLGMLSVAAVNNHGALVGCYNTASGTDAFIYQDGAMTDLGPGCADAVNDQGVVAGHTSAGEAVEWKDQAVTHLGVQGRVSAINNAGVVLGVTMDGTSRSSWLYRDGSVSALGFDAYDINDSGQIAGNSNGHAVVYQDGTLRDLGTLPGGSTSRAVGINNAGVVVGMANAQSSPGNCFMDDGTMHDLGGYANAVAINNVNQVLCSGEGIYGYLWQNGTSTRLGGIPAVVAAGWHHMEPVAINDQGWIVGYGFPPGGSDYHDFLLIPGASSTTRSRVADFNADGHGDLVAENPDGSVDLLFMQGVAAATSSHVVPSAAGHVIGTSGDFNGDGTADLLFRHDDGGVDMWIVSGATVTPTAIMPAGNPWSVVHVADFDGDGKSDILWQNTDGAVGLWLMDGPSVKSRTSLMPSGATWSPTHVADLNGDGRTDIVWRNADGSISAWLMLGEAVTQRGPLLGPGSGWSVVEAGDFNGDGKSDLVLQHADGTTAVWLMDGLSPISKADVMGPNGTWTVTHVGDFDGDGQGDLVWLARDGTVGLWLMNGTAVKEHRTEMPAGSAWSVTLTTDANGDGKSDLVWSHASGAVGAWMMNGTAVAARGAVALPDPAGHVVSVQYQQ